MNNAIIPLTPGLLALLSGSETGTSPYKQEIFLLDIIVAGTTFCKEIKSIEPEIVPEKVLTMKREPGNKHDKHAIVIYCDNVKIGFVPADLNLVCSRLMDAGKMFFGRVVSKEWKNEWLKVKVNVYMVE